MIVALALAVAALPRTYVCPSAGGPLRIDGRLNEAAWARAPWTEDFVDIEGDAKPAPTHRTRAKMLWDAKGFTIGAEMVEPLVCGTLRTHDSVIYHDNDFEVFLDPDGDGKLYVEMEMNALNTTWDLLLVRTYREGGPPVDGFEIKGMRTAVHVAGTLNDARDRDRGWSVEVSVPWDALRQIAGTACPPKPGDTWRVNFSRVEWDVTVHGRAVRKLPGRPEHNWVWSPQGAVDMHLPDRWGKVTFVP